MGPDLRPLVIRGIKKCIRILPLSPSKKVCVPLLGLFSKIPFYCPIFCGKGELWVERKFFWGGICKWPWKRGNERPRMEREKRKPRPTLQTNPLRIHTFLRFYFARSKKNLSWDSSENEWLLSMKRKKEIDIITNIQNDFAFFKQWNLSNSDRIEEQEISKVFFA